MRTCRTCKIAKPLDQFGNRNAGTNFRASTDPKKATCKACDAERARIWRQKNKGYRGSGKNTKYPQQDRLLISAIRARLNVCKTTFRKRNGGECETDLDADYLYDLYQEQGGRCVYTGEKMALEKQHPATISIDKIVPAKGYVRGNVQWTCWAVNRAKGDLPEAVFIDMCKRVAERATTIPEGSTAKRPEARDSS